MIRLSGVDAPELANCNGREAKTALEKLVLGQNLYLKVIYRDRYNRLISHVYNSQGFVSSQMAELGLVYDTQNGVNDPEMDAAAKRAKAKKLGVYSPKCTQVTNTAHPTCVIKGNIRQRTGANLYRFPGCGQYNNTLVQLALGDRWFCTEQEAKAAGFTKGSDCFDHTWP